MKLDKLLAKHEDAPFLLEAEKTWTYADFGQQYADLRGALRGLSDAVLLEGDHSFLSYARLTACLTKGITVIPATPQNFSNPVFWGELALGSGMKVRPWPLTAPFPLAPLCSGAKNVSIALFPFVIRTSGTSGNPGKLVLHDFQNFLAKHLSFPRHFSVTSTFSPFDSIAGMETLSEVIAHGASMARLPKNLNPEGVAVRLRAHSVDYFQTTPSYLLLLLASKKKLPPLKKIAFGSEPVPTELARALREAFPGVELNQTYGMTEIGILRTTCPPSDCSLFLPDPIRNPHRIVNGLLEVKSPSRMLRYLNHPGPGDDSVWFPTSDVVQQAGGYLRVVGRCGEGINIGGHKFFPSELESLILKCDNVADVLVIANAGGLLGTKVIARISLLTPEPKASFDKRFKIFLETSVLPYMRPNQIEIVNRLDTGDRFKKMRC